MSFFLICVLLICFYYLYIYLSSNEKPYMKYTKKDKENIELTIDYILKKFSKFLRDKKSFNINNLSKKWKKTSEETIKLLKQMENEGKVIGFTDEDNQYFYLTLEEIEALEKILKESKNKKLSDTDLNNKFEDVYKLDKLFK